MHYKQYWLNQLCMELCLHAFCLHVRDFHEEKKLIFKCASKNVLRNIFSHFKNKEFSDTNIKSVFDGKARNMDV